MKPDTETTKVIFRKFPDGDVIALFPEHAATRSPYTCSSYMHIGQHAAANLQAMTRLKKATRKEYAELAKELRRIGYNLKVISRVQPGMLAERERQCRA